MVPFRRLLRNCSRCPREEMAIEIIEESCPEGATRLSARGFNPGNRPKPHRALKGRHIDWPSSVKKTMYSPPVSACTSTGDWSRFGGARSGGMERVLRCPFRARRRGGRFLGLKPQAESYSPFGAPEPRSNPENQRIKAQNATNSILLSQLPAR